MSRITKEQIRDVYAEFRDYIKQIDKLEDKIQKNMVDTIKEKIVKENKYKWNDASLTFYLDNLFHLYKGEIYSKTIQKYAEEYYIEQLCKDFGDKICENAKKSLQLHKEYYRRITVGDRNTDGSRNNDRILLKQLIKLFIERAIEQKSLKTNDIIEENIEKYRGANIKISFGQGNRANKPWIAFLFENNKVSNGIYPIISFFIKERILVVGKGVSDKNMPALTWNIDNNDKPWANLKQENIDISNTCRKCYYRKIFKIENIDDLTDDMLEEIINTIDEIIKDYPSKLEYNLVKNIILYGVPGVGKTYSHKKLIDLIESKRYSDAVIFKNLESYESYDLFDKAKEEDRVKFITFHQSFGYEDFIEGFRPNKDGKIELKDGIFKAFCKKAGEDKHKNYYFIIDEINRGNISKIFGELITLIEEDKRDTLQVELPYSKESFSIPSNIYIIGTMNSTDKSIALIDIALRRRFTFLKMKPNLELVENEEAKKLMEELNNKIKEFLGEDYQIGHSYFMNISSEDDLEFIKNYKIKPLLEEYFYGNEDGYNEILEIIEQKPQ